MTYPDVIPYNTRANSQLSVAKYTGGIKIQGDEYVLDYASCTPQIIDGKERYFPDLVKLKKIVKPNIKIVNLF